MQVLDSEAVSELDQSEVVVIAEESSTIIDLRDPPQRPDPMGRATALRMLHDIAVTARVPRSAGRRA
jgi:hypothetical protein